MIIQNDILSHMYIYCMGYETYKTPKHTSKKIQLSQKSNSTAREEKPHANPKSKQTVMSRVFRTMTNQKKSVYLTVQCVLLYCALHMHVFAYVVCSTLHMFVCLCLCVR